MQVASYQMAGNAPLAAPEDAKRMAFFEHKLIWDSSNAEEKEMLPSGVALESVHSPKELLNALGGGAYTTSRTVQHTRLLDLDIHVQRILNASRTASIATNLALNEEQIVSDTKTNLKYALQTYIEKSNADKGTTELRVYLAYNGDPHPRLENTMPRGTWVYVEELPDIHLPIQAEVRCHTRHDPQIKSVAWNIERKAVEKRMSPTMGEVILATGNGELTEGLSSNFYVVQDDNTIQTAPDSVVLSGSIRKLVLKACASLGVNVNLTTPSLAQRQQWLGAAVSSTSRSFLPIRILKFPEHEFQDIHYDIHPLLQRLRNEVDAMMYEASQEIECISKE